MVMAVFAFLVAGPVAPVAELLPGAVPPPIKVAKWVKGNPVERFEPGHVYVVEFWATWCGPCKQSIPHLTELAHQYKGQATFIGVNVNDKDEDPTSIAYVDRIARWVDAEGPRMDYNVCVDDLNDTMGRTWLAAAKQDGIPAAFVINQEGKICWIGNPLDGELDVVLAQAVKGRFDVSDAERIKKDIEGNRKQADADIKEAGELAEAGKTDAALAKMDHAEKLIPERKQLFPALRYSLVARSDPARARALGRRMVDGEFKDDKNTLVMIGGSITYDKYKSPDYPLAIQALKRALQLQGNDDPVLLGILAEATFLSGQKGAAASLATRAIAAAKAQPEPSSDLLAQLNQKLSEYQKR